MKPEIECFGRNCVVFKDGSRYTIDTVIYCTGKVKMVFKLHKQ